MGSITENSLRNGNFTSSEIFALTIPGTRDMTEAELTAWKKANPSSRKKTTETTFGEKSMGYIEECNHERKLLRSIDSETNAKPTLWGKVMESFVFKFKLDLSYQGHFQITKQHPTIPEWVGSVDVLRMLADKSLAACDVKCPYTLKSFCKLVDPLYDGLEGVAVMNAIRFGWVDKKGIERKKHTEGEKYYWQIVSNAIIHGCAWGELLVFCPYQKDLPNIREFCDMDPDCPLDSNKTAFINFGMDNDLPWLPDDGYYKDLTVIRFPIPQADIDNLIARVLMARTMLIPR
jgi:hypothetical protein